MDMALNHSPNIWIDFLALHDHKFLPLYLGRNEFELIVLYQAAVPPLIRLDQKSTWVKFVGRFGSSTEKHQGSIIPTTIEWYTWKVHIGVKLNNS